jgi:hypothetical protein
MPFRKIVLQNKFLTARRAVSSNSSNKDTGSQQQAQQQRQRQQNSIRSSKGNGSVYGSVRKVDSPSGRSGRSECVSGNSVYEAPEEQNTVAATATTASVSAADITAATPSHTDTASASTSAASSPVSTATAAAAVHAADSTTPSAATTASALQLIAADLEQLSGNALAATADVLSAPLIAAAANDL